MPKWKKPTFAKSGHGTENVHPIRKIQVANGCRYYQVDLGRNFGPDVRKNFANAKKARAFAAKASAKAADGVINAVQLIDHKFMPKAADDRIKATELSDLKPVERVVTDEVKVVEFPDLQNEALEILNPFEVSLYEAACFYAEYHGSVEYINSTKILIEQFIADYQTDLQHIPDNHAQKNSTDVIESPSLTSESMGKAADDEAETLQFPDLKHRALEILNPSNEMHHEVADRTDSAEASIEPFVEEEQVQADRAELQPVSIVDTKDSLSDIWKPPYIPKNVKAQKAYTPSDVRRIMKTAKPELVPYLVLGMFGGLRSTEILKLRWRDIDFELAEIQVNAGQSKVRGKRIVHMQSNLGQFLVPFRGKTKEFVVPYKQETLQRWSRKLFKELEIKTINQGARHSFAMYHLASHPLDETMQELGYAESAPLHKYYRGLTNRRREQAAKYFAIAPLDQVEIIQLKKKEKVAA